MFTQDMEHDACGVGLIASTEGKKSRKLLSMELKL
jgi:glutamate synthase (NADPH/NADH) large chain